MTVKYMQRTHRIFLCTFVTERESGDLLFVPQAAFRILFDEAGAQEVFGERMNDLIV